MPPIGTETAEELLERASSNGNAAAAAKKPFDGRAFRRALGRTGRYQRNPVNDPASLALMEEHGVGYSSTGLVAQMRLNGNVWQQGVRSRPAEVPATAVPTFSLCAHLPSSLSRKAAQLRAGRGSAAGTCTSQPYHALLLHYVGHFVPNAALHGSSLRLHKTRWSGARPARTAGACSAAAQAAKAA